MNTLEFVINGRHAQKMQEFTEMDPKNLDHIDQVRSWLQYILSRFGIDFLNDEKFRASQIVSAFQDRYQALLHFDKVDPEVVQLHRHTNPKKVTRRLQVA